MHANVGRQKRGIGLLVWESGMRRFSAGFVVWNGHHLEWKTLKEKSCLYKLQVLESLQSPNSYIRLMAIISFWENKTFT